MQFAPALDAMSPMRAVVATSACLADPVAQARHLLDGCMAQSDRLLALSLDRRTAGYARTFLFGDDAVSVWAMTWDAGAATSIHDHHCACCFGILAGELTERRFAPESDDLVVKTFEAARRRGFTACLVPAGPNIHQMINLSPLEAVSVHVYGFDRHLRSTSIEREYRLARPH